ncbi:hypothetical protein V6N12_006309 [Hibiscus sabdariffa]|uniref:Uncharacterized protein n=1 Tax=Hibiscus sabdariffa TaxID=183260 RepID=A0ABR2EYF3_9ROSI
MKRQGSQMEAAMGHEDRRKKNKRAVETKEEGGEAAAAAAALCGVVQSLEWYWEEWQWLRGAADEQMPWASVWSPLWDMDYVDKAYGALFGDVAWDDDIWDLKTVMVIPQQ